MTGKWARCNLDGRPISPGDQVIVDRFAEWLACTDEERRDPRWHEFLGIKPGDAPRQLEYTSEQLAAIVACDCTQIPELPCPHRLAERQP